MNAVAIASSMRAKNRFANRTPSGYISYAVTAHHSEISPSKHMPLYTNEFCFLRNIRVYGFEALKSAGVGIGEEAY